MKKIIIAIVIFALILLYKYTSVNDMARLLQFLKVITLVGGWLVAVFVFKQLSPRVQITLYPKWHDFEKGVLHLQVEIKNNSKVRVQKKGMCLFQILVYDLQTHVSKL
ncbi:MAG: hypothetical protein V1933_06145 [Candidatus Omnitrophota bacterium]